MNAEPQSSRSRARARHVSITMLVVYKRLCELEQVRFTSTDEDPGLRIKGFVIIKLRGVTTKFKLEYIFHHATQGINY